MQAVQFQTVAHDGVIPLPEQYRDIQGKPLEVILLVREPEAAAEGRQEACRRFLSGVERHRFHLPDDYRFERESLHER